MKEPSKLWPKQYSTIKFLPQSVIDGMPLDVYGADLSLSKYVFYCSARHFGAFLNRFLALLPTNIADPNKNHIEQKHCGTPSTHS